MKTYGGHNRQKGHSDIGVLLCIVSKNDRGNNNDDEEDYMEYVKEHFIPVWCPLAHSCAIFLFYLGGEIFRFHLVLTRFHYTYSLGILS